MPLLCFDYVKTADFCGYKRTKMPDGFFSHRNASNALFECLRGKIKGATENGNFFYEKWLY